MKPKLQTKKEKIIHAFLNVKTEEDIRIGIYVSDMLSYLLISSEPASWGVIRAITQGPVLRRAQHLL